MLLIDFPFILLFLTITSGLICLVDRIYFAKKRPKPVEHSKPKLPLLIDYSRSLFPVFLLVILLRSFVGQLFVVPTGSLEPTVKPGDYILVTQYPYGIHLPVWHTTLFHTGKPKRGDIAVFHWPVNPRVDYIKRVIGLPGDKISYINKVLYINGVEAKQTFVQNASFSDDASIPKWPVKQMQENLLGVKHDIYVCGDAGYCPTQTTQNFYNLVVPADEYLMMGDNRDDSDDSRFWGFVPAENFVGKAEFIFFSWNSDATWKPFQKIRWDRIGRSFG